jgi:intracellular sulfur oxidation DsrE/DsrF family protein
MAGIPLLATMLMVITLLAPVPAIAADTRAGTGAELIYPGYESPKVVYDFYLDDPAKINSALYWIRSLVNPLMDAPYDQSLDFMDIKVVIHGTEIVALAKKNYDKYKTAVERMRYYAEFGVEFRICGLAAEDYGYRPQNFQDFVKIVPSALTDLAHWQQQGYALIRPIIMEKKYSIEEIR